MDSYGQVGPEKPGYDADVLHVRGLLGDAETVAVQFAARSTNHWIVLSPWMAIIPHGATRPPGFGESQPILVAIDNGQAAFFPMRQNLHPAYVAQYLGQPYGDGPELADFLNGCFGVRQAVPV